MKKATKRLMMVVAILLCLVLISTSVVSGVFARFVIEKESVTEVTLNKFGVEVTFTENGSSVTKKGDSIIYTNDLTMSPGDSKTITARIKGKPNVAAILTIDVDVSYTYDNFKIPGTNSSTRAFTKITTDTVYFPIGFKVANTSVVAPYSTNKNGAAISNDLEDSIETLLKDDFTLTDSETLTAEWAANKNLTEKDISLNFYWPENHNGSVADAIYDEIGTYLSRKNTGGFTVTYTISVVQDPNK